MSVSQIGRRETVVDRILSEVAEEEDCGKLDLPPLFEVVDPDAFERLLEHGTSFELTFTYNGHDIVLDDTGEIDVSTAGRTDLPEKTA